MVLSQDAPSDGHWRRPERTDHVYCSETECRRLVKEHRHERRGPNSNPSDAYISRIRYVVLMLLSCMLSTCHLSVEVWFFASLLYLRCFCSPSGSNMLVL
uniref:Uncharacterized protein n=1 Tax=Arundo donax TaxID=35708 RepID=A0A0A9TCT3_ARUDO